MPYTDKRTAAGALAFALALCTANALPLGSTAYPVLQAAPDAVHPLIDQLDTAAIIVPWTAPGARDILMTSTYRHAFGWGTVLFKQTGTDERGLPLYDGGMPLEGIEGIRMQAIQGDNGLFDLITQRETNPKSDLLLYRNTGSPGKPVFGEPVTVLLDGKSPGQSLKPRLITWSVDDIDGDGVPDLLMAVVRRSGQYQPGGSMWNGEEREDSGPGRGFDIQGQWLGDRTTSALMWAKGVRSGKGTLSFTDPRDIYYKHKGFRAQLRTWEGNRSVRFMKLSGKDYILLAGDLDHLFALPVQWQDGDIVTADALPVLENGARTAGTYYVKNITPLENETDGKLRLMLDGNPGRLVVIEGSLPGNFTETGSLNMRGGALAVDTLATPIRFDWDGDGLQDLVIGDSSGFLTWWPGTENPLQYGSPLNLRCDGELIHHQAGEQKSIQGPAERRWGYTQPTVGDWNGDGSRTIITNDIAGAITLYDLTDTPAEVTNRRTLVQNGKPLPVAWRSRPAIIPAQANYGGTGLPVLLHLDWDGDLAVAIPDKAGSTEIDRVEKLRYTDGRHVRLSGPVGLWGRAELALTDWDGDGNLDVIFGTNRACIPYFALHVDKIATIFWLRNEGTTAEPVFRPAEPIRFKDGSLIDLGVHNAPVWPTDLNGDGHTDIIIGAEDGKVYYFLWNDLTWK